MNSEMPKGVLDGYKVLDFTQYVAGPTVTLMMAEMGAEIIKVELAPGGDKTRLAPMQVNGRSGYYVQHNRGKKSLCVDPKTEEGLAILKGLVAKVDVVVENFAPGVIARMGLGWDSVKAINPRAIMCSVSAFGQTGPLANQPGFDRRRLLRHHQHGRAARRSALRGDGRDRGRQHRGSCDGRDSLRAALSRAQRPRPASRPVVIGYLFSLSRGERADT
jgi:hypothetical protein